MSSPRPHSVQWWLGALVTGVAAPILVLVVALATIQVRREQREARETALHIARGTAERLRAMRKESTALLARMAARPGCAEFAVVDFLPRYADLYLFDEAGRLVCSGNTDPLNARLSALVLRWIQAELRAGRLRPGSLVMHSFDEQMMAITVSRTQPQPGTMVLAEFADVLGRSAFVPGSVISIVDDR